MKKMTMISEIHQLSLCFLYKCFFLHNKTVKEMLICNFVYILVDLPIGILGMSAVKFHLLCAIHVKTISLNY